MKPTILNLYDKKTGASREFDVTLKPIDLDSEKSMKLVSKEEVHRILLDGIKAFSKKIGQIPKIDESETIVEFNGNDETMKHYNDFELHHKVGEIRKLEKETSERYTIDNIRIASIINSDGKIQISLYK
jgi:hypothetical protein